MKLGTCVQTLFFVIAMILSGIGQERDQLLVEFVAKNVRPHTGVCRGFGYSALHVLVHQLSIDVDLRNEFQLTKDQFDAVLRLNTDLNLVKDTEINGFLALLQGDQKDRSLMVCLLIDGPIVLENLELSSCLHFSQETRTEIERIRKDMGRVSIGPLFSAGFASSTENQKDMELAWTVSLNILFGIRVVGKLSVAEKTSLARFIERLVDSEGVITTRDRLLETFYRPRIGLTYDLD